MIVPLGVVTLELPERPRTEDVRIMRWPLRGTCRDTPPVLRKKKLKKYCLQKNKHKS